MFKVIGKTNIKQIKQSVEHLTDQQWNKWKQLQDFYDSHDSTLTYPLFWSMPDGGSVYRVTVHDSSSELALHCKPLIEQFTKLYKASPIAAAFSLLRERRVIPIHSDLQYSGICRVHVPIVTNDQCYMFGDDMKLYNWKEGHIYELDPIQKHGVVNGSRLNRIHLIVDFPTQATTKDIVYESAGSVI